MYENYSPATCLWKKIKKLVTIFSATVAGSAGGSGHSETFLDPDYIKQRVYLHDALLRKLTLLEYLPFDDNVCVREPCLNFETCTPVLKFAGPEKDVMLKASTLMLRSVDPLATYSCDCPQVWPLTQFLSVSFFVKTH